MRRAALSSGEDYGVRRLAEQTCAQIDSKDYSSEYLALYYMVLQRCRYMRDPRTVELVRAPYVVVRDIAQGGRPCLDCDDLAALLAALCLAVGGHVEIVTVAFRHMFHQGERQFSHVFVRAQDPRSKQWIVLDPVAAERTQKMLRDIKASKTWSVD
jgi:hypothetical protein